MKFNKVIIGAVMITITGVVFCEKAEKQADGTTIVHDANNICHRIINSIKNEKVSSDLIGEWDSAGFFYIIGKNYIIKSENRSLEGKDRYNFPTGFLKITKNNIQFVDVPINRMLPVETISADIIKCQMSSRGRQVNILFFEQRKLLFSFGRDMKNLQDFCIEYDFKTKQEKLCELPKLNL